MYGLLPHYCSVDNYKKKPQTEDKKNMRNVSESYKLHKYGNKAAKIINSGCVMKQES